jgi:uncharacterized MAPEG superfamily protein
MTFAFWMVLAGVFLPIVATGIAKAGARDFDNARPRDWQDTLTGWRRRADWAQRNQYEAFPPFAAGVVIATLAHAPQPMMNLLAGVWVLLRLAYLACYLADRPSLRSIVWGLAFACTIGLFVIGV